MFPSRSGQLAWEEIISARLEEFEYEKEFGLAIKWHVAGIGNPIVIDPRVAFGTPTIKGVPTWIIVERWNAGEEAKSIANDFSIAKANVKTALVFEGIEEEEAGQDRKWVN